MPKKTTRIIIDSGSDYLIRVKGNQKKLYSLLKEYASDENRALDFFESVRHRRGRKESRRVWVYEKPRDIDTDWAGLNRIIKVERIRLNHGHTHQVTAFYISSLEESTAERFHNYIQLHWSIENRLHWVKDVTMKEDKSKTAGGMAAENISLMRNISINLFITNGMDSIKYATQRWANNINSLLKMIYNSKIKKRI